MRRLLLALLLLAGPAYAADPSITIPVELTGIQNVGTNGSSWCIDSDGDGVFCEGGEPVINTTAALKPWLPIAWTSPDTTPPSAGLCAPAFFTKIVFSTCDADGYSFNWPYSTTIRKFCGVTNDTSMDSDDVYTLILRDNSQTYATIVMRETGGDLNEDDSVCVTPTISSYTANTQFFIEADVVTGSPGAGSFPWSHFVVYADAP